MAKKKPSDEFDVDAAMAAEGIAMPDDDVDAAMAAEGIAAPTRMQAPQPESRRIAEEQLFSGLGESPPIAPPKPRIKSTQMTDNPMGKTRHSYLLNETDPEVDRDQGNALYQGFTNVMGLGIPRVIRDTYPEGETFSTKDRARLETEQPAATAAGKGLGFIGSAINGPGKILDTAARGAVAKGLPWLAGSAAGRIAGAGLAGAGSGAVQGAALEGDPKGGAIAGGAFGAGAQALGEAGRGLASLLGADKWIGKFRDAKADGRMARVEAGGPSADTEGQFTQAAAARDRILSRDAQMAGQEGAAYKAATEPHLQQPADKAAINESLLDLSRKNQMPSTGKVIDSGLDSEMKRISEVLGPEPTVEDVLTLRRSLQETADFANPKDPTARAYSAVRQGVRGASPEVAAADDAYSAAQAGRSRRFDIMSHNESGPRAADEPRSAPGNDPIRSTMRVQDEKNAAVNLSRLGDESVEGGRSAEHLRELGRQDPEFQSALDDLMAYKAWLKTRAGLPPVPANLNQAVRWPVQAAVQNGRAIGARGLLPAAEAAQGAGTGAAAAAGSAGTFFDMMGDAARRRKR